MADDPRQQPEEADDADDQASSVSERKAELSRRAGVRKALLAQLQEVEAGFASQESRANRQLDYWDLFNCVLTGNQFYNGTSKIFVPIIKNAIEARKTRFVNQIFPTNKRHIEVISDGEVPYSVVSLIEHYIRRSKLREQIIPDMLVNGDVEGHYNLYVDWQKIKRHVAFKVHQPVEAEDGLSVPDEMVEDVQEETIERGFPRVEVLADSDVLVLPFTAHSVDDALQNGGSVTVIRRWSKAKIEQMIEDEEIDDGEGKSLLKSMSSKQGTAKYPHKDKHMVDAAGVHMQEGLAPLVQVYETWCIIKVAGERRLCRTYYAGDANILSCKRNPFWHDKCPVISARRGGRSGSFKGKSDVEACETMQLQANDAVNEGMDSAAYALMPIVMTDPEKNPRVGSMILNMAAIWQTNPKDTQFAQFPQLWTQAFEIVNACKAEIFQALSVTPAIMPQSSGRGQKRNQAEIASEQQVDVLNTADVVTGLEGSILTPLVSMFLELDHQFRDEELTVQAYGEMGLEAKMEAIPPIQMDTRYEFVWLGVEAARNAQQMQQQIATLNVLRGVPPQQYADYTLDVAPVLLGLVQAVFNPRIAQKILKSKSKTLTVPPEKENELLAQGFDLPVHPLDEDAAHLQKHQEALQNGDPAGMLRAHIQKHLNQMNMKVMAQAQQAAGGPPGGPGQPGVPGGNAPGVAGTPRPGAQPMPPRGGQNPPGAIHADQLRDPARMPRRMA